MWSLVDLKQKFPMNVQENKMNGEKKIQYEVELLNDSWASLMAQNCICLQYRRSGFNPWIGKIPRERNGNLLQYSCLGIPWTEEPGRLQSMGSQRVRNNWVTIIYSLIPCNNLVSIFYRYWIWQISYSQNRENLVTFDKMKNIVAVGPGIPWKIKKRNLHFITKR